MSLKRRGAFYGGPKAKVQKVVSMSARQGDLLELKRQQTLLGSKVRKIQRQQEKKYHDEVGAEAIVNNINDGTSVLVDPAQGDTVSTRDGDEIAPQSLELRLGVRHNGSGQPRQLVRVLIVQAKERFVPDTRTSTPSNTAVLKYGGTAAYAPLSPFDWNNREHFTVLFDKTYTVSNTGEQARIDQVRIKLSRKIRFAEAGSVTAERGQIYMVRYSNEGANGPYMSWVTRTTYTDS